MAVWLTIMLWDGDESGSGKAGLLSFPLTVVSVVLAILSVWLGYRVVASQDLAQHARELAAAVRSERQQFIDDALGARRNVMIADVEIADPDGDRYFGEAKDVLAGRHGMSGEVRGTVRDLFGIYRRLREGRLAVLGGHAAGKTVALSQLTIDLIDDLSEAPDAGVHRVPLFLTMSRLDEFEQLDSERHSISAGRLQKWLAAVLEREYAIPGSVGISLVRGGWILPVIDSLDEMDQFTTEHVGDSSDNICRAAAILGALNFGRRSPVIVGCRTEEYESIARDDLPLVDADHVVLQPLRAAAIRRYLDDRLGSARYAAGWTRLLASLETAHPMATVLRTPVYLSLALQAYGRGGPDTSALAAVSEHIVRQDLLQRFVESIVEGDTEARRHGWHPQDVRRWLATMTCLEDQLREQRAVGGQACRSVEIHLPDLWLAAGRRHPRLLAAGLAGLPSALFGLALCATGPVGVLAGLCFAILGWRMTRDAYRLDAPIQRITLDVLRGRNGRSNLRRAARQGVKRGLIMSMVGAIAGGRFGSGGKNSVFRGFGITGGGALFGVASAVVISLSNDIDVRDLLLRAVIGALAGATIGFALCLVNCITVACVLALADEVDAVTSMRALVRQGVAFACLVASTALVVWTTTAAVAGGIAAGWLADHFLDGRAATAGGLAAGLAVATVVAAIIGLTGCWVNALGPGRGYVWVRYLLGVRSAARRGLLPGRPAIFIDWCLRTGLMRRCGTRFQFRHPDLGALVAGRHDERPAADRVPATAKPSLTT